MFWKSRTKLDFRDGEIDIRYQYPIISVQKPSSLVISGPYNSVSENIRNHATHCTGGWVGLRAGLDTEVREKILSPLPGIESRPPGRPARIQTLYWLSYAADNISVRYNVILTKSFRPKYLVIYTRCLRCWTWPLGYCHHEFESCSRHLCCTACGRRDLASGWKPMF
jgi:hypothetical protein